MTRASWILRQLTSQLWFRAAAFGAVGIAAALFAYLLRDRLPAGLDARIGADSVSGILGILASSMLAVTTFALGIMVSAFSSAASSATPQTTQLLRADPVAQTVLSTFIGAFLFSIVGIVALEAGLYGANGRFILFLLSIATILIVVAALLRWIDHLSHFGLLSDTVSLVEKAASRSLSDRLDHPCQGAACHPGHLPDGPVTAVRSGTVGYVQNVDMPRLAELARDLRMAIYVEAAPGCFSDTDRPVAHVAGQAPTDAVQAIAEAFHVGRDRSFEQDPRFGLVVLSEIASRALSPAVNDPGTAIAIITRGVALLAPWMRRQSATAADREVRYPDVFVPPLSTRELLDDLFVPIARDGAGLIEVQIALQKAYASLARLSGGACAAMLQNLADQSERRAAAVLGPDDLARLGAHRFSASTQL